MFARYFTRSSNATPLFVGQRSMSTNFNVRRLTTPEEVRDIINGRAAAEGWRPGALDHVSYFEADPAGFFVGELDGKPIGCISALKYSNFAFIGNYIVDKQYRGRGYGLQMCITSLDRFADNFNLAADAVVEKVKDYRKFGLEPYWKEARFEFVACEALTRDADQVPNILTPSEQLFPSILEYDTSVNTIYRRSFMHKWVFAPNSHCSVAIDNFGKAAGYGVARSTLWKKDGWTIGPLFADNASIARAILQDLFTRISVDDPQAKVVMDVPYGSEFNSNSLSLVSDCKGRPITTFVRIYSRGVPEGIQLKKIFGLTSVAVGC